MKIKTSSIYLTDLFDMIKGGDAVPAKFQRPYVWTRTDVEAFWISIIRGYPLGSFLLWRPKEARHGRKTLGPINIKDKSNPDLILDGQNRLVTLAWSLSDPFEHYEEHLPGGNVFDKVLVLDPYEKTVKFVENDQIKNMIMPVYYLLNGANTFFRKNWKSQSDDEAVEWLDNAGNKLREAKVIVTTINDASDEEAKEAFLHIARAGVPMSEKDFMEAVGRSLAE